MTIESTNSPAAALRTDWYGHAGTVRAAISSAESDHFGVGPCLR